MTSDLPFVDEAEERKATVTTARRDRSGPGHVVRAIVLYWRSRHGVRRGRGMQERAFAAERQQSGR